MSLKKPTDAFLEDEYLRWEPVQETGRPTLKLISDLTNQTHPFVEEFIQINDPFDPIDRNKTKQRLQKIIDIIDAKDYKMIESDHGFQIFFCHDYDLAHFQEVCDDEKSFKGEASNTFHLEGNKKTFIKHAKALSLCFAQVIVSAGLVNDIDVEIDPSNNDVNVYATTLQSYLTFWRGIPEAHRQLLHS